VARPQPSWLAALAWTARRADLALFQRIAGAHNPVLGRSMPALSRAADWSRLWLGLALLLTLSGRPAWRRAAARGIVSVALASGTANGLAKLSVRRRRPPLGDVPLGRRVYRAPVTTSFPSGHAASAVAFTVAVARQAPELAVPVGSSVPPSPGPACGPALTTPPTSLRARPLAPPPAWRSAAFAARGEPADRAARSRSGRAR
jgi:hypothetical protein